MLHNSRRMLDFIVWRWSFEERNGTRRPRQQLRRPRLLTTATMMILRLMLRSGDDFVMAMKQSRCLTRPRFPHALDLVLKVTTAVVR